MVNYILKRILMFIPTLFFISLMSFAIIQLPPGDFLTAYAANLAAQGESVNTEAIEQLRQRYGLGDPFYIQYFKWMRNMLRGDFGQSLEWNRPVSTLIGDRLMLTMMLSLLTLLFTWIVAIPIGIYSAVRKYSFGDYFATFLGFLGLATPDFLFALAVMWLAFVYFNTNIGGLFSPEYVDAPWSIGKVIDMLKRIWLPILVMGLSSAGSLIRVMRNNLLDELHRPYVETARAKGMAETRLILKYPVRVALNPFVSTIGYALPTLISGSVIVSVVLSLPTIGPLLLRALVSQDMYLAGACIFLLSSLTLIGTLISDVLLAWLDPRIQYQ